MPAILERCVTKLLADPNFKPKSGNKKSSAYAVCTTSLKKAHKMNEDLDSMSASDIIKLSMVELDTKKRNNLENSDFAYIDKNGDKHLPIHDAIHVRNALARFNQTHFDSPEDKSKAMAKIKSRAKELGVKVSASDLLYGLLYKGYLFKEQFVYPLTEIKASEDGSLPNEIQIMPIGSWDTVPYGELKITASDCEEMIENFKKGVRAGDTLPIDVDHDGKQAAGWITDLHMKEDGLYAYVDWNDLGKHLLGEKRYKFFSPEFNPEYKDPENQKINLNNVLIAGSLVNRPLFKELQPLVAHDSLTRNQKGIMLFVETMDLQELHNKLKNGGTLTAKQLDYVKGCITADEGADDPEEEKKEKELAQKLLDMHKDNMDEGEEGKEKVKGGKKADEADEADEGDEGDEGKEKKKAGSKKASEPYMRTISAAEYDTLKKMADRGVEAAEKLEAKEIQETISTMIFSENGGHFPPALETDLVSFYKDLSSKQRKTFSELVDKMPDGKVLFNEIGSSEVVTPGKMKDEITVKALEMIKTEKEAGRKLTFSDAVKKIAAGDESIQENYRPKRSQSIK